MLPERRPAHLGFLQGAFTRIGSIFTGGVMISFLGRMSSPLAAIMLCAVVNPAAAIQPTLENITQESDGTVTYHFKIKIDETVQVESRGAEPNPDFFTIFNFLGMAPGSEKQLAGWTFSTSANGVTPYRGGRTVLS